MINSNIGAHLQPFQKKRIRIPEEDQGEVIVDGVVENPLDPELHQIKEIDETPAGEDNSLIEFEKVGPGILHLEKMSSSYEISKMDWQNGNGTIQDRMKYLLETGEQSDVEFLVGKESDQEEPQLFKAHKLVLAGWDVFAAQFRVNKSNSLDNELIRVIDITASAFKAMMNFLYTNDTPLINSKNFLEVYSAAKKYLLRALIEKCHELAPELLSLNNSIAIWKTAKLQEDKILIEHCLHFLDEMIIELYYDDHVDFWSLSQMEFGELLNRDTIINCHEITIFNLLDCWADKQCKDAGIVDPTGQERRAKMGYLINAVRFPLIDPELFVKRIVPSGILNAQEVAAIFVHYCENANDNSKQIFPMPFSAQPRAVMYIENNKLVDKNIVEREKTRLRNKIQRLEARMSKANARFRARRMPTV